MSQNNKNATNFLVYNLSAWVPAIVTFALFPIYTAYLTPSDYGIRAVVLLAALMLQLCTNMGTTWIIRNKYYTFNSDTERNVFISSLLLITFIPRIILFILFFFIGSATFPLLFKSWEGTFDSLFKLQLFVFLLSFCQPIFAQVFIMERRAKEYSFITLFAYFCNVTVLLYLLVLKNYGISSLFYGELVSAVVFALFSFFMLRNKMVIRFRKETITDVIKIGIPAVPKSLFSQIQQNISKYILQIFLPIGQLGLFSKSQFLDKGFSAMFKAFSNAFSPSYIKNITEKGKDAATRQIVTYWLFLTSSILLLFILFLPDIFKVMRVNPAFWICAKYAPLLGFQAVLSGCGMMYSNNILISQKTYLFTARSMCSGIINIILSLLLIPWIGVLGAILAYSISHSLVTVFGYYFSEKILHFKTELNLQMYILILSLLFLIYMLVYFDFIVSVYIKTALVISYVLLLLVVDHKFHESSVFYLLRKRLVYER